MPRLLLTCLCALALALPALAQAQAPRVDPDSPAGSEYQLPVDRAREQARERPAPQAGSSEDDRDAGAPLFGAGVQAQEPKRGTRGAQADSRRRDRDRAAEPTAKPAPARRLVPDLGTGTPDVRAQASAPDDGGSGLAAVGGAAVGVLLLGGLAGLAWRRRTVRR